MNINLHSILAGSSEAEFETDVCIVGSGPAGLTIAHELRDSGLEVILLESGDRNRVDAAQQFNSGSVIGGPYADLRSVRHRQIGGTVNLWNTEVAGRPAAKYLPLDTIDFEQRSHTSSSGWPLGFRELSTWYQRAQHVCGLGPFDYDARRWLPTETALLSTHDNGIVTKIYQFGPARPFVTDYPDAIAAEGTATLIRNATVTELVLDGANDGVRAARICGLHGRRSGMVRARTFVLAAGAIENARLLLMSQSGESTGIGNRYGWVGRCFMEHPRDYALTLVPKRRSFFSDAAFFGQHLAADGTTIMGRLALSPELQREEGLLQASATLLPGTARQWRSLGMLKEFLRMAGLRRRGDYPIGGVGWSARPEGSEVPSFVRVLLNLEQAPNPDNRVVLGNRRDAFGGPLVELHWRWRADEQAALERVRRAFVAALESADLGKVRIARRQTPDPNAHHHAGTTRMSADPRDGVVNSDCRVHGIENLFLAGASTFPTAGMANPTLTIVALALRLARHLRGVMMTTPGAMPVGIPARPGVTRIAED